MEKKIIYYTNPTTGKREPIEFDLNELLSKKSKKKSKLTKKIATRAIALALGVGMVVGAAHFIKGCTNTTTSTTTSTLEENNDSEKKLRFDPNSKESIITNSVLLVKEAAKCGQKLDAEDAVIATIVANSNELTTGFMGELFGEKANQTYTYGTLVDTYLRVAMMQVENIGVAKDAEVAFNFENIFANQEDYNYLNKIRELTTRYNNSTDKTEKLEITNELNQIAADLCTSKTFDISSSASILSMLSLDGMHIVTANTGNPVLHDDIRDEIFGDGDYGCATSSKKDGVVQTQYSYRVNDLKLDSVKTKLDNAVLVDGKTVILDEIIDAVKSQTKDVKPEKFNVIEEINNKREENRTETYEYEEKPGVVKPNYSEKTKDDVVQKIDGKDVIVVAPTVKPTNAPTTKQTVTPTIVPTTAPTTETTQLRVQETETKPVPEIKEEQNVTPKPNEEIANNREEALDKLDEEAKYLQEETDKGAADGKYYGENGMPKPSLDGKSDAYISAFNTSYDAWKAVYDAIHSTEKDELVKTEISTSSTSPTTTVEEYSLNDLNKDQLEELKNAALGEDEYAETKAKEKTK